MVDSMKYSPRGGTSFIGLFPLVTTFFFLTAFISFNTLVFGEEVRIDIQKVDTSPKIDGYLEESFWGNITPLKGFIQYEPYNGKPASEETIVYIAYDEDNLYIAFNCLDSQPEKIKGDLTPRERYSQFSNDFVRVLIDTYYDKRNSYRFDVNPKGVQNDGPGDYIWKSGAAINEDGWSTELKIPFKSIRFPTGSSKPIREELISSKRDKYIPAHRIGRCCSGKNGCSLRP
jgi:hypothetical protein